jgi:hypothetical protein
MRVTLVLYVVVYGCVYVRGCVMGPTQGSAYADATEQVAAIPS